MSLKKILFIKFVLFIPIDRPFISCMEYIITFKIIQFFSII